MAGGAAARANWGAHRPTHPHPSSDRDVAAATSAARASATHLLDVVDADVSAAFERERAIGRELRGLRTAADCAAAAVAAWAAALTPLDAALRELGDSASFLEAAASEVEGLSASLTRLAELRAPAAATQHDASR